MDLKDKISQLPLKSGVYIFKNSLGKIIYIGKATNLRNRVRSYFTQHGKDTSPKIKWLSSSIDDLDYILVNSPVEALILEADLIKRHRPFFNSRMKDDKRYPFIEITLNEEYPRIRIVRKTPHKKSRYFGPFTGSRAMRETFKVVQKVFQIRTCKYDLKKPLPRPCLDYHIHLCPAPCTGYISVSEYRESVKLAIRFLEGRTQDIIVELNQRLADKSEKLEFEKCILLRDLIKHIEHVTEKRIVMTKPGDDYDFIGISTDEGYAGISVLEIRDGRMLNQFTRLMDLPLDEEHDVILNRFIMEHYRPGMLIPSEILTPLLPCDQSQIQEWLTSIKGRKVELKTPDRGEKKTILQNASANAEEFLNMKLKALRASLEKHREELEELKNILGLSETPNRIEGFDISNLGGKMASASMVVFAGGEPFSEHYRRFKIKSLQEPNDFLMMNEALKRRFKNLNLGEMESFKEKPNLILIDGGKGQLSSVMEAAEEESIKGITIISLAKREEEIFLPDSSKPIRLDRNSPALKLLMRVRDEAHRFAVSHHRKMREKQWDLSILDGIPGIARNRKETLLRAFGSIEAIKQASLYELEELPGFNRKLAESVLRYLGSANNSKES